MIIKEISDFKKDELRYELRNEPPNNFAVYINGKKWKVFKGNGIHADDSAEERHFAQLVRWAQKKSAETGKDWQVGKTGEPVSEALRDTEFNRDGHKVVIKRNEYTNDHGRPAFDYTTFIDGKKLGTYPTHKKAAQATDSYLVRGKGRIEEGTLVFHKESELRNMLDTLLKSWKQDEHTPGEFRALVNALGYKFKKVTSGTGEKIELVKAVQGAVQSPDPEKDVNEVEEYAQLLKAMGYRMEKNGNRTTLVKEAAMRDCPCCDGGKGACSHGKVKCGTCNGTGKVPADFETEEFPLEEAPGAIRKGMAAIALIAGLWGVNNHMAQKAYDASPQLQKLTAYLEVAKQHNDQRMIDQLEQRIENHKMRISVGKGEVMGKDGYPIDVVYDKEKADGALMNSAEEPKADTSARAKLNHSLVSQGHRVEKDKKKELKKGAVKHKGTLYNDLVSIEKTRY